MTIRASDVLVSVTGRTGCAPLQTALSGGRQTNLGLTRDLVSQGALSTALELVRGQRVLDPPTLSCLISQGLRVMISEVKPRGEQRRNSQARSSLNSWAQNGNALCDSAESACLSPRCLCFARCSHAFASLSVSSGCFIFIK